MRKATAQFNKVWMRMGDNDDYREFDSPHEAGYELGPYYDTMAGDKPAKMPQISRHGKYGIDSYPGFENYNYISLFWGDAEAQPGSSLTNADLAEFKRGVREGGDIPLHPEKKITHGITSRRVNRSVKRPDSALGGTR